MSNNGLYGGIFPSINLGAFMSGQKIPKVDGTKEADKYPTPPNSRETRDKVVDMYTEEMSTIKTMQSIFKD